VRDNERIWQRVRQSRTPRQPAAEVEKWVLWWRFAAAVGHRRPTTARRGDVTGVYQRDWRVILCRRDRGSTSRPRPCLPGGQSRQRIDTAPWAGAVTRPQLRQPGAAGDRPALMERHLPQVKSRRPSLAPRRRPSEAENSLRPTKRRVAAAGTLHASHRTNDETTAAAAECCRDDGDHGDVDGDACVSADKTALADRPEAVHNYYHTRYFFYISAINKYRFQLFRLLMS